MSRYITEQGKRVIACVAGTIGVLEDMIRLDMPEYRAVMPRIKACRTHMLKVLETGEEGIDADQRAALIRWCNAAEIMVMPRSDPRAAKEYAVVEGATLERIVKHSLSDCACCLNSETEVKQCQLRKDLLQCGIMPKPNGRGHCPFQP